MAWTLAKWNDSDVKLGGITLKASAPATPITANTTGTSYYVGKGKLRIVDTWTTRAVDGNDELYSIVIEANTRNDTSTYYEIGGFVAAGAYEVTGKESDDGGTGSREIIIDNPYDYQIRYRLYVLGSTVSSNFSIIAYPLGSKN